MTTSFLAPETIETVRAKIGECTHEISKVYIGPQETTDVLFVALLARGHVLLEGVPGIAKTTLCKVFSRTLGCRFRRIQFTPDLLPSDITGTYVLDMRDHSFVLREGPIFANIILGDEINRAPAKTQSALLEAMQESQVTIEGTTRSLPRPFMVLATQNPVEHEGTYPLPEAQLDRFLIKLPLRYPSFEDEKRMLKTHSVEVPEPSQILSPQEILTFQQHTERVYVDDEILEYVLALVAHTRKHRKIALGASPRAALHLVHAAKAHALLVGRDYVIPDDIKWLAPYVLTHRILVTPEAELDGLRSATVVSEALASVPYRRSG